MLGPPLAEMLVEISARPPICGVFQLFFSQKNGFEAGIMKKIARKTTLQHLPKTSITYIFDYLGPS